MADVPLPVMGKLYILGTLEMEYLPINQGTVPDFTLNCTHIFVNGGRLIAGWEDSRYTGNGQIVLRGDHLTPDIPLPNGPNMGAKVLGTDHFIINLQEISGNISISRLLLQNTFAMLLLSSEF